MRKVKISVVIFIIISIVLYSRYYTGLYFDFNPNEQVTAQIKTEGKTIYISDGDNKGYKRFEIKGVELSSSIPGNSATNHEIDKETWIRWFEQIKEMGANTIRISTIYNDTFYNAFYEFNYSNKDKLYLIQGIQISDYANNSGEDAYSKAFFNTLQRDSAIAIDVIHGKRNTNKNETRGSGRYRKDVSPWVLGYVVGNYWNPGTMAYTNNNKDYDSKYEGKYFITTDDSTVFEAMLAKIMDDMVSYETKKYKTQRLVSFINDPQNDPFTYEKYYAKQLNKYNILDAENIKATSELKSGYIATYFVYDFRPEFTKYFSDEQKLALTEELETLNQELIYDGYTQLLAKYHTMPVIIFDDGYSTSRGTDDIEGPITEEEQGQKIVQTYEDIINSGCSGSIISSWQDSWERRTWNTSYAVNVEEAFLWRDVQTKAQGYGLLSFEAGDEKSVSYVDGDKSEWNEKDMVFKNKESSLSVKYDESFIYILFEKKGLSEDEDIFIPIDTTPKSGSNRSLRPRLKFDRNVDFILNISGRNNSRVIVQDRYEVLRQNYLMETEGDDPFISFPKVDSSDFVSIRMVCKNNTMIPEFIDSDLSKKMKLFDSFETGKLVYGNGNPKDRNYNSLSDFYYGNDFVEVRLPWQMLNFSNPSKMSIHDDYYENYGVEEINISKLYIGIAEINQKNPSEMMDVKLDGWGNNVSYHERLKKSYFILKEKWGN